MSQEQSMWATVKANPADGLPRLVLADWCDENGKPDLAYALRWSARRGRYPMVTPYRRYATWGTLLKGQHKPPHQHQIPRLVFDLLRPVGQFSMFGHRSKTAEMAFERLAEALKRLRDVIN